MKIKMKNSGDIIEFELFGDAAKNFPIDLKNCLENKFLFLRYFYNTKQILLPSDFLRNSYIEVEIARNEDVKFE